MRVSVMLHGIYVHIREVGVACMDGVRCMGDEESELTDCDADGICLVGHDRYVVCGHDGEFVSVEAHVDPVVDSNVDKAE